MHFFLRVFIYYLFFLNEIYVFIILPCFCDKVARCVVLAFSDLFCDFLLWFVVLAFKRMIACGSCFFSTSYYLIFIFLGRSLCFSFFLFSGNIIGGGVLVVSGLFGDCLLCFFCVYLCVCINSCLLIFVGLLFVCFCCLFHPFW